MVGQSNYDRAYLMALGSWKLFGHSPEPARIFAERIAEIGLSKGVSAAAEAIAEDCRQQGLQMSSHRVLKGLSFSLERYHDLLSRLDSIEQFPLEEIGKVPPGLAGLIAELRPAAEPQAVSSGVIFGILVVIFVLIAIGWLVFR